MSEQLAELKKNGSSGGSNEITRIINSQTVTSFPIVKGNVYVICYYHASTNKASFSNITIDSTAGGYAMLYNGTYVFTSIGIATATGTCNISGRASGWMLAGVWQVS